MREGLRDAGRPGLLQGRGIHARSIDGQGVALEGAPSRLIGFGQLDGLNPLPSAWALISLIGGPPTETPRKLRADRRRSG